MAVVVVAAVVVVVVIKSEEEEEENGIGCSCFHLLSGSSFNSRLEE